MKTFKLTLAFSLFYIFSFAQKGNVIDIVNYNWKVDSVLKPTKPGPDQIIAQFNSFIKEITDSAYFIFRSDSTYEIFLMGTIINNGWWKNTKNNEITIYSGETPAYYGIPIGSEEIIMKIEVLLISKTKRQFRFFAEGSETFVFIVKSQK